MERINRKIHRTPLIYQLQPVECSAASLGMILGYFGKWVTLDDLRYYCNVTRDGASVLNIVEAAEQFGLVARAYRRSLEDLKNKSTFPCILHWNFAHFVVLCGFSGDDAIINDPARGSVVVKHDEIDHAYTGIVIEFEKSESFVPSGKKPNVISLVLGRLMTEKRALIISLILTASIMVINFLKPLLDKVFIDNILMGEAKAKVINHYFYTFVFANKLNSNFIFTIILLAAIEILCLVIREKSNVIIEAQQAVKANTSYMWHLLNVPFEFFERRESGDLHQRKNIATNLVKSLIDGFVPFFFQILMSIFYVLIMLFYNIKLGIFGIASIIISLLITAFVNRYLLEHQQKSIIDSAVLYSSTVSGIEMIETIKKGGNEDSYINDWIGALNRNLNSVKKIEELNANSILLLDIINNLISVALIYFGVRYVLAGSWTIGVVIAFQGFYNNCTSQILGATENYKSFTSSVPNIDRIDDVSKAKVDDTFMNNANPKPGMQKFKGTLTAKGISFRYKAFGDMLLSNIDFNIAEHEKVAIVGKSGCGKSTFAKILMGMYKANEGSILYDNKKIGDMNSYEFYSSMQYVNINSVLFNDTIMNNLRMWDDSINIKDVARATTDAEIFDDINKKEKGFYYTCSEKGKEFSGGQRQRLELARALAIGPNIMILDEATNALDLITEKKVLDSIFKRGITTIFITHRLSIMERCDRIVIMEDGKIVEEGKHEDLLKNSARYNELIMQV